MAKSNTPTIKLSFNRQTTFYFDGELCSDTHAAWQKDSVKISNTKIQTLVSTGLPFRIRQGQIIMGEEHLPPIAKVFEETIQQADKEGYCMSPLFVSTQLPDDGKLFNVNLFQHSANNELFGLKDTHYTMVDLNSEILSTGSGLFVCNNKTIIIAPLNVRKEDSTIEALYHALQRIYDSEQPTT